jgi:methyl-accepting chemotaxis protein
MSFLTSSVRRQLIGAFFAVSVTFLVALVVGLSSISSVDGKVRAGAQQMTALEQASGRARDMAASELGAVLDPASAADHATDVNTFRQTLGKLRAYATAPAAQRALDAADGAFANWQSVDNRVLALAKAGKDADARALAEGDANRAADGLTTAVEKVSAAISNANTDAASSTASSGRSLMLILAALALAAAAAIVFFITRDLAARVGRLLEGIRDLNANDLAAIGHGLDALATGDLTVKATAQARPIETTRQDELGQLTATFNSMVQSAHARIDAYNVSRDKVAEMLKEIGQTSERLAAASQQMASSSQEAGRAVDEIAQAVTSVAAGAEDQVRTIAQARQLTDEVAAASQMSATGAQQTAEAAAQARDVAEEGALAVSQVTEAMLAVRSSSNEASTAIRALDAKSEQIGQIVDAITGIAEQTNLLALNAAIEAARVGEQGRGFAVVAEEVRKLAEESQAAASSIAALINEIQHETRHVVDVVEDGSKRTEEGAATVEQARDAFTRISQAIQDVGGKVEQIAGSVQEIAAAGQRVQDNMTSVAAVAEQSSASSQQVSASTEETSASTEQIAASAGDLAQTAAELERLVGQFTLA